MHTAGHGALEEGSDDANEAEEAPGVLAAIVEEVIGHEWQRELHPTEEEDESQMGKVE